MPKKTTQTNHSKNSKERHQARTKNTQKLKTWYFENKITHNKSKESWKRENKPCKSSKGCSSMYKRDDDLQSSKTNNPNSRRN